MAIATENATARASTPKHGSENREATSAPSFAVWQPSMNPFLFRRPRYCIRTEKAFRVQRLPKRCATPHLKRAQPSRLSFATCKKNNRWIQKQEQTIAAPEIG